MTVEVGGGAGAGDVICRGRLDTETKKNKIHSIKCLVSTHPSSSVIFTSIGVSLLTSSSEGVGGHLDVMCSYHLRDNLIIIKVITCLLFPHDHLLPDHHEVKKCLVGFSLGSTQIASNSLTYLTTCNTSCGLYQEVQPLYRRSKRGSA